MPKQDRINKAQYKIGTCSKLVPAEPRQELQVFETEIKGVRVIKKSFHDDARGWFQESFRKSELKQIFGGKSVEMRQGSISYSRPGVIRGIHGEMQYKMITPLTGRLVGAYVDLRPNSPTFTKWVMLEFDNTKSEGARTGVLLEPGIGNSFGVLGGLAAPGAFYIYSVSEEYGQGDPGHSIRFNDEVIGIPWNKYIPNPFISESRDLQLPGVKEVWPDKFK